MDIFLCFYKCHSIFWEQQINARSQVLTAVLLCLWVRRFRRFDRPYYLHPQRQAVICDWCKLSGTSRDFENSGWGGDRLPQDSDTASYSSLR